jgi:L-alanine-DL-glutamate epimerase-like enolase superfamily enzyme
VSVTAVLCQFEDRCNQGMGWCLRRFPLTKAVPLAISRGTTTGVEHLLLRCEAEGVVGLGEAGGLDTGHRAYATAAIAAELAAMLPALEGLDPSQRHTFAPLLELLSPPARCAVDLALWDWWGQRLGQPLWRLFGLDGDRAVATSVTLGLGRVEQVLQRLERWWQQRPATRIKLKLGSPEGLDHDRKLLEAVAAALQQEQQQRQQPLELQVDANGGWSLDQAKRIMPQLLALGVVLLEQPIAASADPELDRSAFARLKPDCPLPLVADESCWDLEDLLRLAPHVDGINLKLLKTGGLSEALLMARVGQRLGLDLMVGCYSDSSLLNGAAAQLLSLIRWPDLDSHLNLLDDPFQGLPIEDDRLRPPQAAGLGMAPVVEVG